LIEPWCAERGVTPGEVLPASQVWTLSQRWYHDRLSPDYRSRTAAQVQEIFRDLGLTSDFWRYDGPADAPQK
jgi:hypothetical protein